MQEQLNTIFGTDFKVRTFEGGYKVTVPSIDLTQMFDLTDLYKSVGEVRNITAKRSDTGITVIVEVVD